MSQAPSPPGIATRRLLPALARWLDTRSAGWLLTLLAACLVVGMAFKYAHKVRRARPDGLQVRSAIDRWLPQLRQLDQGVNIFQVYQYPNPPIMALILMPLTRLDPFSASLVWYSIKVLLTVMSLVCLYSWVGNCRPVPAPAKGWALDPGTPQVRPFPMWAIVLALLLSLRPILGDLEHGNVNLFILFLVIAALTALHWRKDWLAGVIMGLAIACKVTPALFLPYFIWKRAWRALAGSMLGLVLFLWPGLVPAALLGWQSNQDYLQAWYHEMVCPYVFESKVTSEMANQSLPGVVWRLATHSPADSKWDAERREFVPTRYANLLDLSPRQANLVVKGFMGLFVLLVVWSCRTSLNDSGGWRLSAEFGLVVVGMLLFSERTWKHHCVTLAIPFAVLCYYLAKCSPGPVLRGYLIGTLAAATLLIASTSVGLLPESWAETAQIYGAYVWANFLLVAAQVVVLIHR